MPRLSPLMDWQFIIPALIVLILGSALQSAAGFAFGMFAIPLLILLGAEAYEAIAIISVCGLIQTVIGIWALRKHIDWLQVVLMTVMAAICIPAGVLTLGALVESVPVSVIRQVFGSIVLCVVVVQWVWRIRPREKLHWGWMATAMPLSGFMTGLSGMGGPPAVMWVMAHNWSNRRSRATLWAFFCATTPVSWISLHQRFGDEVFTAIGNGVLMSPVMILGILPGLWLGHRIPKPLLRQISYVILLLVSAYAICQPLLAGS
ncbi:MAG: sulfite exporter TauE/SafE family protein [Phycisphaerales bacterium]|nr:MAG: sulfite exporter TauE/SafE family protein [Phycisphaerales bacterium]